MTTWQRNDLRGMHMQKRLHRKASHVYYCYNEKEIVSDKHGKNCRKSDAETHNCR